MDVIEGGYRLVLKVCMSKCVQLRLQDRAVDQRETEGVLCSHLLDQVLSLGV